MLVRQIDRATDASSNIHKQILSIDSIAQGLVIDIDTVLRKRALIIIIKKQIDKIPIGIDRYKKYAKVCLYLSMLASECPMSDIRSPLPVINRQESVLFS